MSEPRDRATPTAPGELDENGVLWGHCPRCLKTRPGNQDDFKGNLSFAPPCPHCGCEFIPEREPRYFVYVCPTCLKQHRGPSGGHAMAGDGQALCHHGERLYVRLKRVEVFLPNAEAEGRSANPTPTP